MEYIVTYQFDEEDNLWKTTKFTDGEKAENYYNTKLNLNDIVYFGVIINDKITENNKRNKLIGSGNKYKITYFQGANYKYVLSNNIRPIVETVTGRLINYDSPFTGRFFIENDNGALEIIPMTSVVEMREIVE